MGLCKDFAAAYLSFSYRADGEELSLKYARVYASPIVDENLSCRSTQIAKALFRITQQARTNIYRHADATEVRVRLRANYGMLVLNVADNAAGSRPAPARTPVFTLKWPGPNFRHACTSLPIKGTSLGQRLRPWAEVTPILPPTRCDFGTHIGPQVRTADMLRHIMAPSTFVPHFSIAGRGHA